MWTSPGEFSDAFRSVSPVMSPMKLDQLDDTTSTLCDMTPISLPAPPQETPPQYVYKMNKSMLQRWTQEEDRVLQELLEQSQFRQWGLVARQLSDHFPNKPSRSANQCNQRWCRVLNPRITKGIWSEKEDRLLIENLANCQPRKWKQLALLIPGRSDIQVRYRVNKLKSVIEQTGLGRLWLE